MSVELNFSRITRKWTPLRIFAGRVVESALEAVRGGQTHVAQYFAKLLYFLPFAPMSIEKVLVYSLAKASRGFIEKNPNLYEVTAREVPGFEPDEVDKVKVAFESLRELGIADLTSPETVKLKPEVVDNVVAPIAPYLVKDINLKNITHEAVTYTYKTISGVSALYVMHKTNRLPSSFTIMAGLLSPTAYVKKGGIVESKFTIELSEWTSARSQMSKHRQLRNRFDVEYFKAVGILHENRIITGTYPTAVEVAGTFVSNVIVPTYKRYYELIRMRWVSRMRK